MEKDNEKKGLAWWLGLIIAVASAIAGYLTHNVLS